MKKIILLFTFSFLATIGYAQNDYGGSGAFGRVLNGDGWLRPGGGGAGRGAGSGKDKGNGILKIKLDGIPALKLGLGYEYVINNKVTFGVDVLYQIPGDGSNDLLNFDFFYDQLNQNGGTSNDSITNLFSTNNYFLKGATINRFYVLPEFRLYFGNAPRGFYAGLYFKYRQFDYDNDFLYVDSAEGYNIDYNLNFKMNTASAGLSIGFQSFISKTISLDVLLFGIQYSSNIGGLTITTNDKSPIRQDIQDNVTEGVDYLNTNLPIASNLFRIRRIDNDIIDLESRFSAPSIRLPSIRLGLRF